MDFPKQNENELDALGAEALAGSGFEEEEPEPGFITAESIRETETSGLVPDQNPA